MASNTLMPNHFQGLSSEDAERWWEDVEHWCAFKNLTEEEKVGLLPLLLKGGARHWYGALTVGEKDTFVHIKEAFLNYYKRGDEVRWRNVAEVWETVQIQGQSVEEYLVNIQEKAIRTNFTEEQTRLSIINGFKDSIRRTVIQHEITTIAEVKRWALFAERSNKENDYTGVLNSIQEIERKFDSLNNQGKGASAGLETENTQRSMPPSTAYERTSVVWRTSARREDGEQHGQQWGRQEAGDVEASWRAAEESRNCRNSDQMVHSCDKMNHSSQRSSYSYDNRNLHGRRSYSSHRAELSQRQNWRERATETTERRKQQNDERDESSQDSRLSQQCDERCYRCGLYHTQYQRCPARGAECWNCYKMNHFQTVCKQRRYSKQQQRERSTFQRRSEGEAQVVNHTSNINKTTVQAINSNKIKVKIFNDFVVALIDTGYGTSCMSSRLVEKLRVKILNLDVDQKSVLFGANGSPMRVKGKALISMKLGGLTVPYEFLVVDGLSQNLILGIDFLKSTQAVINCIDRTVTFYDDLVEVNILNNTRSVVACIDKQCRLEPRSESDVPVYLSERLDKNYALLEPMPFREKQKYLVAKAVIKPTGKYSICRVMNPTNQVVILKKNLPIATVEGIEENAIAMYDDGTGVNEVNNFDKNKQHSTNSNIHKRTLEELGIKVNNANLTTEQNAKLTELLQDNSDLFAMTLAELPCANTIPFKIDTGDAPPIRQRPYMPNPMARKEVIKQTQEMLDSGIIVPSTSQWGSPCLHVTKKDDSKRFCIDFRKS